MDDFRRPFLSTVFYALAVILAVPGIPVGLAIAVGFSSLVPSGFGLLGLIGTAYGWMMLFAMVAYCSVLCAIGYAIELLARTAWNTQPERLARAVALRSPTSALRSEESTKRFYIEESGRIHGPFTAAQMMAKYRDGQLSNQNPVIVEENGVRRPLSSWKEIGL